MCGFRCKLARAESRLLALQVLLMLLCAAGLATAEWEEAAEEGGVDGKLWGRKLQAGLGQGSAGADRRDGDYSLRIGARINRSPVLSKLARMEGSRGSPARATSFKPNPQHQPPSQAQFAKLPPFQRVPSRGAGGALGAVRNRQQAAPPRPNQHAMDPHTGMYVNEKKPSIPEAVALSRRMSKKNLPLLVDYGDGVDPEHAPKDYVAMPAKMRSRREAIIEARGGPNAPVPRPPPAPRVPQHEKKLKISGVPKPVKDPVPGAEKQ